MTYKKVRIRFKNGHKYKTYTTRYGKNSKYNSKSWRYNGKLIKL